MKHSIIDNAIDEWQMNLGLQACLWPKEEGLANTVITLIID